MRLSFFCSTFAHAFDKEIAAVDTALLNRQSNSCLRSPHHNKLCRGPHWSLIASDSSTPNVRYIANLQKMQNYLRNSNFYCIFAASLNERRPTPADVEYILNNLTHQLDSQKSRKFQNHINWHMLVHVWCTTFAVFVIRAMREPL